MAPERLVFLDECGVLTNMARLWGRSPRGTRAYGTVPCGHWKGLTVLGGLGIGGIVAAMSVEAATSGAVFLAYLEQVLPPELRRSKPARCWCSTTFVPTRPRQYAGCSIAPASSTATCRPTRQTSIPSSPPGPSSRLNCAASP